MTGIGVRRMCAQLSANIEWIISICVNHEAQMEASLQAVQERLARASVELRKVRDDHAKLCQREAQLTKDVATWTDRARRMAQDDKERALECVRRRRLSSDKLKEVRDRQQHYGKVLQQLERQIADFRERVEELKRRRNVLRLRTHRTEGEDILDSASDASFERAEKILDEWEVRISRLNDLVPLEEHEASWEKEMREDEEQAELEDELQQLLKQ
jgi:phage shock protein A